MIGKLKFLSGAAALALFASGAVVQAADAVEEPGCLLSGSVMAGYMYDWQSSEFDIPAGEFDGFDVDWDTPFGEGAGLVTCGGLNIQADIAYYAHSADVGFSDADIDQTNTHIGGVVFYRDPSSWAGGVQASWISQDVNGLDTDVFRVGLFGELYLDVFTLGASAHYFDFDRQTGVDEDGFELAAWGRFYATPDFSLLLRGDLAWSDIETTASAKFDFSGFAITGEAEYLVWDQGLSLFAGARYADREVDIDDLGLLVEASETEVEDFQVFAGIKFYFGNDGTLLERQRTGTVDNTSVFHEKLPEYTTSTRAAFPIQ